MTPALSARSSGSSSYDLLYKQAARLVSNPVAIMPFSTPTGFVHMLKHLRPDVAYVTESLTGDGGRNVESIRSWIGQTVVVVGGDAAGLVDETEDEQGGQERGKWWERSDMIGLGKGVEIVEASNLEEHWRRRIEGRD